MTVGGVVIKEASKLKAYLAARAIKNFAFVGAHCARINDTGGPARKKLK
jgi:hypothetical protein